MSQTPLPGLWDLWRDLSLDLVAVPSGSPDPYERVRVAPECAEDCGVPLFHHRQGWATTHDSGSLIRILYAQPDTVDRKLAREAEQNAPPCDACGQPSVVFKRGSESRQLADVALCGACMEGSAGCDAAHRLWLERNTPPDAAVGSGAFLLYTAKGAATGATGPTTAAPASPRRMRGNPAMRESSFANRHSEEHDETDLCRMDPPCVPVIPDLSTVQADADRLRALADAVASIMADAQRQIIALEIERDEWHARYNRQEELCGARVAELLIERDEARAKLRDALTLCDELRRERDATEKKRDEWIGHYNAARKVPEMTEKAGGAK